MRLADLHRRLEKLEVARERAGLAAPGPLDDAAAPGVTAAPAGPETFRAFVERVHPRFRWYEHCVRLAAVLQRVADGELGRVVIGMPPRHGKSEILSRLFPAYYLTRYPERWVGLASYAAELAQSLSRNARDFYRIGGGPLKDDAAAVKQWETGAGGGLWAAGFGGPATGKGFHLGIIDDPIKNAEEAASVLVGNRNRDWYRAVFSTRGEPGEAVVVCMTRWPGPGDLVGFLYEEEEADDQPERWHVVSCEARKEDTRPEVPTTCTLEPDWRRPGEALCPERYPVERLARLERRVGPFYWRALYQQRPRDREGGMFPREAAAIVADLPARVQSRVRYWDFAATEGGGDWTVGVRLSVAEGVYYVEDVVRVQYGSAKRDALVRQTAELDGVAVPQHREQEPGSSGKDAAHAFVRLLAGFTTHAAPSTGDKVTRADPFASQWQVGNVRLVRGPWNAAFLADLADFPAGRHDDQVDAASGAFAALATTTAHTGLLEYYRQEAARRGITRPA